MLLIPEIIDLAEEDCDRLMQFSSEFGELGLRIERFGLAPSPCARCRYDARRGRRLADQVARRRDRRGHGIGTIGKARIWRRPWRATDRCGSGRRLRPEEMNALLRQMEMTPAWTVQSRPADLYRAQAFRHRAAVRPELKSLAMAAVAGYGNPVTAGFEDWSA